MYSKKYMFREGQTTCIKLIEEGYVLTFEEIHNLMITYRKVKEEAERGTSKVKPKDFSNEHKILRHLEEDLKKAEDAMRKGSFKDTYELRMNLGKYFHELEGYHWLALHFYESSQSYVHKESIDVKLALASLQRQAILEENRGNLNISLKYLKKAEKLANKNSLDDDDELVKDLRENLCRIYQQLGLKYLEREDDTTVVDKSMSVKYFKKAVQLGMTSNDLETLAACYALQGKAMMKFNENQSALKSFELYTKLSEKNNDNYGICQGFFVISEIFKRNGDFEQSTSALNKCQELSKKHSFDIPFIFSSLSLGQIETIKKNYSQAYEHFREAYNKISVLTTNYSKKESLKKLTKVMYGIGKAHLSLHYLTNNFQTPISFSLTKLLKWRRIGGPYNEKIDEKTDYDIDIDETEKVDEKIQLSKVIERLISHEIDQP